MEEITPKTKTSPGFFFLSLGVLIALITSVTAFLNLAFETLNFKFPDALNATYQYGYNSYNFEGARMAMATLIIFFPILLVIMRYWKRNIEKGLGSFDETIRKWLIYIVLFFSALIVAIDLVTLVKYFVSGEITTRFILKVLVVLVVAVFIGVNYIFELRGRKRILGVRVGIWGAIKSSVLVLALVIWSFTVIGTPGQQRTWRLDDRRIQDLQSIQYQVINYWQQKEKMPDALTDLSNPISSYAVPVDPEFEKGMKYEYNKTADLSFELCATFSAPMPKGWQEYNYKGGIMPMYSEGRDVATSAVYPYPGGGTNESWDHQAGRTCFTRTIDKDLYPPYPKPMK